MARPAVVPSPDFRQSLLEAFAVNDRINQVLLEHLDPRAWRAKPPGRKGRTIAAIFAHVHNIRCKWLRLSAPHLKLPARLDRARCTQRQASAALAESAARCNEMLADALASPEGRMKHIIADKCACWRISSDSHSRSRPPPGSGFGKSCGSSAGSPIRGEVQATHHEPKEIVSSEGGPIGTHPAWALTKSGKTRPLAPGTRPSNVSYPA